jgi:hypothetical protein
MPLGYQDAQPGRARVAPLDKKAVPGQVSSRPGAQQPLEQRLFAQSAGRIEPEALAGRG